MIRPGTSYTAKAGDTFKTIAAEAYGDETLWTRIAEANVLVLADQTVVSPYSVAVGESVFIPRLPERKRSKTGTSDATGMTVEISGRPVEIIRGKIYTSIDTVSDSWEVETAWNPGVDPVLDEATRPYRYSDAVASIGSERLVTGQLFDVAPRFTGAGRMKILRGFSYAKHAVDSSVNEPFQYSRITLEGLLKVQLERFNIRVFVDEDTGGQFRRVAANKGQTVFSFLSKLATHRGILITSTETGDLRVLKPAVTGSVGTLEEGVTPMVSGGGWGAVFSGQNRYRSYTAYGASPGQRFKNASIVDETIVAPRFQLFQADDATKGNINQILEWKRSKAVADALSILIPVVGWYAPNGRLWQKNTIVTVKSETLFVPGGYDFLVKSVEYSYTVTGKTTTLHLVPPQAYTKEKVEEPWLK